MIHIVFNEIDVEVLGKVRELDETLAGTVFQIKDDFAVGPIEKIYETEGYQLRRDWWEALLENSPYTDQINIVDDKMTVHQLKQQLDENPDEQVWIWMAQNQHDVCGYYWLMPQLKNYQGRIHILYLNNLPFINEKGHIFYPNWLHEIRPSEFIKAKKLARPITLSEFEIDPDEWSKLCIENGMVRLLEGGKKIVSKAIDFFDEEINKHITKDWQKAMRVLSNTMNKMKIKTGDVFLMGRIKQMALEGKVDVQGDINKGWKDFDIRLYSGELLLPDTDNDKPEQA
ncbi:MAG: DUF1835 domain-containing protein [Chitinophagaceae bacterium]|nr:MAG: DUF1835 domain-containing protein [Chitinophagaceae bacterium]